MFYSSLITEMISCISSNWRKITG